MTEYYSYYGRLYGNKPKSKLSEDLLKEFKKEQVDDVQLTKAREIQTL